MNIGIYIPNEIRRNKLVEELGVLLDSNDVFKAKLSGIDVQPSEVANVKTPAKLEQLITKQHETKPGELLIIEWQSLEDDILVTSDRTIFISAKVGRFLIFFSTDCQS